MFRINGRHGDGQTPRTSPMKKLLLSLAAVASVGTALPAAAQTWEHNRPAYEHNVPGVNRAINQREAVLRARVDQARARRHITAVQAQTLRAELRRIEAIEHQYRRRGLSRAEYNNLNTRLDRVQAQLDRAVHNHNRYGRRW
jgi:hypothetical protein